MSRIAALAGLEVGHEAEHDLGVVGELEVVLDEALELALELFVRARGAKETEPEHAHDEQRAEEDSPEESGGEKPHGTKLSHGA